MVQALFVLFVICAPSLAAANFIVPCHPENIGEPCTLEGVPGPPTGVCTSTGPNVPTGEIIDFATHDWPVCKDPNTSLYYALVAAAALALLAGAAVLRRRREEQRSTSSGRDAVTQTPIEPS